MNRGKHSRRAGKRKNKSRKSLKLKLRRKRRLQKATRKIEKKKRLCETKWWMKLETAT